MAQVVPFHSSAMADSAFETPTAVQAVRAAHDTPDKMPVPAGFGVFWMVHAVPFEVSAKVAPTDDPVAVQAVALGQDRLDNTEVLLPR
jgi:hypothetical protein